MKKMFSVILFIFLFIINVNAEVSVSYDNAVKTSQRYIYKFNKYDKYLLTDKKYIELKGSDTAIIPFGFKNNKLEVNSDFTRGGLLNKEEFNLSKDSNGSTYLSQDVEFFLIGKKAVNTLNNEVIDAGDKKYGIRVTEFVLPGTKTRGSGTKVNPWEFVGTYKLTFYINNGKITNNGLSVNKYIVYAVESTEGQIIVNFEPNSGFEYLRNNCNFTYEYDKTNKIHKIYKDNKDINSDQDCTIDLKTGSFIVEYDYNGGNGKCENLAVPKGNKISKLCTNVSREGYTFKGWQDEKGNTVTNDTVVNGNIKLIAQWEIKKTTLTIKPNGGEWNNQTNDKTIEQEYNTTTTIDNPSKGAIYTITFNGNNQGATISKSSIEVERPFSSWKLTKEATDNTAKLENNTFTFGSGNTTLEANYSDKSNTTTLSTVSKTGHTCKWNTKSDGSGTSYNSGYDGYSTNSNVTLYAICRANTYKVTLNNQSATSAGTSTVNATYGKNIPNITVPTKTYKVTFIHDSNKTEEKSVSYTFGGYYTSTNGGGTQYINTNGSGNKAYDLTKDTTLYAKWTSNSMTLPTSTKTGYTLSGWYTAKSGGTKVGNGGSSYTPTSNITLYAQWTEKPTSYTLTIDPNGGKFNGSTGNTTVTGKPGETVSLSNLTVPSGIKATFNANGGSCSTSSLSTSKSLLDWYFRSGEYGSISGSTYTFGEGNDTIYPVFNTYNITLPNATRTGYTFNGWYTSSSGGTYVGTSGSYYSPTANITLYAHWTSNTYTLTIDPNGGKFNGSTGNTTVTGKPGETVSLSNLTVPSGIKATFNANGGSCSTSSLSTSKSLLDWYFRSGEYGSISGSTYTFGEGNDTIYPVFNTYNITLPNATRTGYTFNGWYTSSSGGTYVGTSGSSYSPTSNTTLYAHWTPITYNISYNLNNGTQGSSHPTSATYDNSVNISNPTKKITVNLSTGTTASGATISSTTASADQTFAGWTAADLNTTTARYGSSSTSINTQWSNGSTKTKSEYYKNLTATNNATVTLTANWAQKNIALPKITKTGYTCGWAASSKATTITYASGSTLAPDANGTTSINLYGVCVDQAPKVTATITSAKNTSVTCTSTYTAENGFCTFNSQYYAPATLKIEATNEIGKITEVTYKYNKSGVSGNDYDTTINSTKTSTLTTPTNDYTGENITLLYGKRYIEVHVKNSAGKTSIVKIKINLIAETPNVTATITSANNKSAKCTSTYTAENGFCTFNSQYYAPATLKIEATNEIGKITEVTYKYNKSGVSGNNYDTTINSTSPSTLTTPTNDYTGKNITLSYGKRYIEVHVKNSAGKTSIVKIKINLIAEKPSLKVYINDVNGKSNVCSSSSCTMSGKYTTPITLTAVATYKYSKISKIEFQYNSSGTSSYTAVGDKKESLTLNENGNDYYGERKVSSPGFRKFKFTATNGYGKTATVEINVHAIKIVAKYVKTDAADHVLRCRKSNNTSSEIVTRFPCGEKVSVESITNNNWYYVPSENCWSHGDYLVNSKPACNASTPTKCTCVSKDRTEKYYSGFSTNNICAPATPPQGCSGTHQKYTGCTYSNGTVKFKEWYWSCTD